MAGQRFGQSAMVNNVLILSLEEKAKIKRYDTYTFMVDDIHVGQVCTMFCHRILILIKIIIIIIIIISAKPGENQIGQGQPADNAAAQQSDQPADHECDE